MATVVSTYWINPLTNSIHLPEAPGEILTAAVAYWQDELDEWRPKRPRKSELKLEKDRNVARAAERIERFRRECDQLAHGAKVNRMTLQLATEDLSAVMKASRLAA